MFLTEAKNVVLLGPPGTGKTHLAVGIGIQAAKNGHRVLFDTAIGWVARLQEAHSQGKLAAELVKLRRYRHSVTKLAIFRLIRTPRTCSSNSFPAVTNTPR